MQTKQEREQAFHDHAFTDSIRAPVWGFYKVTGSSREAFREMLLAEGLSGKHVLEFGSGAAAQAFFLAGHGARVTGIDISPVAVEQGRRRAAEERLGDQIDFRVMDAERLDFAGPDLRSRVRVELSCTTSIFRWPIPRSRGCFGPEVRRSSWSRSATTR